MKNVAVRVENVSKIYKLYNSPRDRLKEALNLFGKKYHREFYAINDLSCDIEQGDTVGIIGKNGSGKSTLLQMIAGVLTPSMGNIAVNGRVSALLELGAGFNPEFTGIENIYMQGTLMGFSKAEMNTKVDNILSFADIGAFAHQPVKTYSSGMFVRLAFSVATQIEPEVLIVDEALSVGDMFFQAKSMRKMRQMIDNDGVTLLFVSHDLASIRALCNKGLLIEKGHLTYCGEATKATDRYFALNISDQRRKNIVETRSVENNNEQTGLNSDQFAGCDEEAQDSFKSDQEFEKKASFQRIQNGKANFNRVTLLNQDGLPIQYVEYDQNVTLRMVLTTKTHIDMLGFGYRIVNNKGVSIVGSNSELEDKKNLINIKAGVSYAIDWQFTVRLAPGAYSIAATCYIPHNMRNYDVDYCDMIPIAYQFIMNNRESCDINAISYWDNTLEIKKI